jgi:hypothetical protein
MFVPIFYIKYIILMKKILFACNMMKKRLPVNFNVMTLRQLQMIGRKAFYL